ncbi:MAG: hypothetical protein Q9210_006249 [Variospora velana]
MAVRVDPTGTYGQTVWIDISNVGLPISAAESGQDDNGDCMMTLDDDCVNILTDRARQAPLGRDERSDTPTKDICSRLDVPEECEPYADGNAWGLSVTYPGIGNATFSHGTDSRGCSHQNQTGANRADLSWGIDGFRRGTCAGANNDTCYHRAITDVTPVITTVWQKGASPGYDAAWSDMRVVSPVGS